MAAMPLSSRRCSRRSAKARTVRPIDLPASTAPPFTLNTSPVMKPACWRTQEQNRSRDLLWLGDPSQRNRRENRSPTLGVIQRRRGHIRVHPAGRDAIHINAIASEFGGEPLDHADQRTLGRSVVAVKSLAALSGGRTDQHDVTAAQRRTSSASSSGRRNV